MISDDTNSQKKIFGRWHMNQYFILDQILIDAFNILQSYHIKPDLITKHKLLVKGWIHLILF